MREYTDGSLRTRDVRVFDWGVAITLPFSKTSITPVTINLARRDDAICPRAACVKYTSMLNHDSALGDTPFLLLEPGTCRALPRDNFINALKMMVSLTLRLDPRGFSGHSLRRGGATALLEAGVSESLIAAHGRWRSLAYRRYLEITPASRLLPTLMLRAHAHTSSPF